MTKNDSKNRANLESLQANVVLQPSQQQQQHGQLIGESRVRPSQPLMHTPIHALENAAAAGTSVVIGNGVNIPHVGSNTSINDNNGATSTPLLPWWYPRKCNRHRQPVYNGNTQALAWALDSLGRALAFIGAGALLGTALLRLAKEAAGCEVDPDPVTNMVPVCDKRVYGIRPSSLLTTYTVVVGVLSASLLPMLGAIVDYTRHRLLVGRICSVILCVCLLPQAFVSAKTWFAVAILQIVAAFVGWAQTMVTFAYLPELTSSEKQLNEYTTSFTMCSFTGMIVYLIAVMVGAVAIGWDSSDSGVDYSVHVAQLGMGASFVLTSALLYTSWFCLFEPRPAAHVLPAGRSLWTVGFVQVYSTVGRIYRELPALKWFYISVAFVDAGVNSLATVAITYMTDTLAFSSQENAIAILLMLVGNIPGAYLSKIVSERFDPVKSCMAGTVVLLVNTIVVAVVLKKPGQQVATYCLGCVWGVGWGWKWTTDRVVASIIIPVGQDAELMGTYLFAGQALTWLPPLIYTGLNEAKVDQQIAVGSLAVWFVLGTMALSMMGSYEKAVVTAGRGHLLKVADNANSNDNNKRNGANEADGNDRSSLDKNNTRDNDDTTFVESTVAVGENHAGV